MLIGEMAMEFPLILDKAQAAELEYEFLPMGIKLKLTRMLRRGLSEDEDPIFRQNRIINQARTISGLPVYVLRADDWGMYLQQERGWHSGEFEACIRRLDAIEFLEFLAELVEHGEVKLEEANELLNEANSSVLLEQTMSWSSRVSISISPLAPNGLTPGEGEIANIRTLVARMERDLDAKDYSAVVHCSASIFETLAKDVVPVVTVNTQTLASFFDRYRKDSYLPEPVLDYILAIYNSRNTEPLAGHGQLETPSVTKEEAVILAHMTMAFLQIERDLQQEEPTPGAPA